MRNAVFPFHSPSYIVIPIYNDTPTEYYLEEGTEIAELITWDSTTECHRVEIGEEDLSEQFDFSENEHDKYLVGYGYVESNHVKRSNQKRTNQNKMPSFIEEDQGMNEEEKELALLEYLRHGYHHPSMTKIIEDKASLTNMYLQSTKPTPESEWPALFDLKHLSTQNGEDAIKVFLRNKAAFSNHACDLGRTNQVEMEIELTSNKPQIQKYIPIAQSVREQVKAILDQMIEYDILRECNEPSPVVSNLLITKKKDGQSIRILLDGRLLNSITKRLPTNLVTHQELCAHMQGRNRVTTIDLSDAFFQIPLAPAAQPLTAFYSPAHGKRYCFKRCPQGLKNSPLHLKILMDKLFGDMASDVIHYADDIMIATNGSFREHLKVVEKVLKRLVVGKIKIRPQKINLDRKTVEFLGMVWTEGKLSIPEAKVLAFKNLPSPNTPKKAKSVICALAYYRKFVPNFAQLSQPIMDLSTLHAKEFKWTPEHETLFRKLIKQICTHATVHLPDPKKPYYVQTDASNYCGAGKLFQKDEEGNELLIACVSRTFTKTERAYSTIKKEVLALLYTLRTMDFFIRYSNDLKILTDAQGILFLSMCKDSQGILMRFSLELSKYDAEVIHVPGVNNEVADVLSRHHVGIDQIQDSEGKITPMTEKQACDILKRMTLPSDLRFTKEEVAIMLDVPSLPNPITKAARKSTAKTGPRLIKNTPKMLADRKIKMPQRSMNRPGVILPTYSCEVYPEQKLTSRIKRRNKKSNQLYFTGNVGDMENDTMSYTDFKTVSRAILTGVLTRAEFRAAQEQDLYCSRILNNMKRNRHFILLDGLLFAKNKHHIKLVLPEALLDIVINAKHFSIFGIHFSRTRMQRDIESRYHIPHKMLNQRLKLLRDNCLVCQFNSTHKQDHELRRSDYIHAPRVTWGVDLIPNLPLSDNGYKAALLAVDLFTGYIQICPIKDRSTKSLIEAVEKTVMSPFTTPKYLRTDEEPGMFRSQEFYDYLKPLGVKFLPTSVGAPWANSTAERSIRTIKEAARNFLLQEKVESQWDKYAHFFTAAHNQSTGIYGYAPEELMFGFKVPTANDLLQFWPGARSQSDYAEKIIPIAEEKRRLAQERGEKKRDKNRSYKNVHRVIKQFLLGQIVAHRQLQLATGSAMGMKPKHTGPYVIVALNPDGCSATIEHLHTGNLMNAHFSNMQVISFHAGVGNRVDANFDDRLVDMLSKKSSLLTKTTRELDISTDFEPKPNVTYRTQEDEQEFQDPYTIDSAIDMSPPHPDFGRVIETEDQEALLDQHIDLMKNNSKEFLLHSDEESQNEQYSNNSSNSLTTREEDHNIDVIRNIQPHLQQNGHRSPTGRKKSMRKRRERQVTESDSNQSEQDLTCSGNNTYYTSHVDTTTKDTTDNNTVSYSERSQQNSERNNTTTDSSHLSQLNASGEIQTTCHSEYENSYTEKDNPLTEEGKRIIDWINKATALLTPETFQIASALNCSTYSDLILPSNDESSQYNSGYESDKESDISFNPNSNRTSTPKMEKKVTKQKCECDGYYSFCDITQSE